VAAENLLIDSLAAEMFGSFRAAGVSAILLKGPSTALWLYGIGERPYGDVDLLVAPWGMEGASSTLEELGFSCTSVYGLRDRRSATDWKRGWASVDVHAALNLLEHGDPQRNWEILAARTEILEVAGGPLPVLQPPARLVSIVLHSLHDALECERYGFSSAQSREDMRRALSIVEHDTWAEAARVAHLLNAAGEFGAGLRRMGAGDLAESIGLPTGEPRNVRIRAAAVDGATESAALTADHLFHLTPVEKTAWVLLKLFPRPNYLRARSRLANRGSVGIVLAYVARPFVLALGLWRALSGLRAARR
jgi:hypothetical protein